MKFAHGSALLFLVCAAVPLAVACGSNDSSGLFSSGGSVATSIGGSLGSSGSVSHAGQSPGGAASSSGGAGGSMSVAGHGASGDSTGGSDVAGSSSAGAAGDSDGLNGGGSGGDVSGSGGSAGSAGASAGAGGMSGGGAGGGGAGGGGAGGGGAGGGGAGAGSGCPQDLPPQDGTACTTPTPDNCFYPGRACSCLPDGQSVASRRWGCYGTPDRCPGPGDTHPSAGASCKGFNGGMCPYSANDFCVCMPAPSGPGEPKWACAQNSMCPITRPGNALCGEVKECAYADRECFCNGMSWGCE